MQILRVSNRRDMALHEPMKIKARTLVRSNNSRTRFQIKKWSTGVVLAWMLLGHLMQDHG
ncbi:hypothetical protein EYZ11_013527 [Aspergillus tanneri]|uniref:Uncharacterized protein n=1 Tax=Aspergillus tanneri TaxID=1220188 RepID=A0A4S3IZL2_9EURO|nr:hypothetical protein EYZ11_013527 [Aspergillus tanneri]